MKRLPGFLENRLDDYIDGEGHGQLIFYAFCRRIAERNEEPRSHKKKRHHMFTVSFDGIPGLAKKCHCGKDILVDTGHGTYRQYLWHPR